MPAPASHTRKTAYNTIMAAIDELSRIQIHAMASEQPLVLSTPELEQLRTTLQEARYVATVMEHTGNLT